MAKLPEKMVFYTRGNDKDGVLHTYPVNFDSEARHVSAVSWATRGGNSDYNTYEFENSNFDNVTIRNLEIRGEGGRAYQVILERDNHKFRVDMREDTLMDVIKNTGIQAGGRLNGTFCFAVKGSQIVLIREQSNAWKGFLEETKNAQANKSRPLPKKDLKVGHLYRGLSDAAIYLGDTYVQDFTLNENGIALGKVKRVMIFLDASLSSKGDELNNFLNNNINPSRFQHLITLKTSHAYRVDKGKIADCTVEENLKRIKEYTERVYAMHVSESPSRVPIGTISTLCKFKSLSSKREDAKLDDNWVDYLVMLQRTRTRRRAW